MTGSPTCCLPGTNAMADGEGSSLRAKRSKCSPGEHSDTRVTRISLSLSSGRPNWAGPVGSCGLLVALNHLLLLRADPADALDLERRPAALFGDFPVLRVDEGARRLVALEPAEQFGRHAAVGAQAVVLIDDVEEGVLAFGIGSGFLRHARLLVDERPPVNRNTAANRAAQYETVSARDPMNLPTRRAVVYEGFATGTGCESAALDQSLRRDPRFKGKRTGTGAGMAIRLTLAALAALTRLTAPALAAKKPAEPVEATAPREAGEPIMAIVSIKSQRVTFYDAEGWILRAPVSTGTTGRETPAGV